MTYRFLIHVNIGPCNTIDNNIYLLAGYLAPSTTFTTYPFTVEDGPSYIIIVFKTKEGMPYDIPFNGTIYDFTVSKF